MPGEIIHSAQPKTNPEHPVLIKTDAHASRHEVYFSHPSLTTQKRLEANGVSLSKDPPALRAVVFEPKAEGEREEQESIGIFYIPGAEGTAAGSSPVAGEFFDPAHQITDVKLAMTASISQFASTDAVKNPFDYLGNRQDRAAVLASFITELVKNGKQTPDQIYLIATSMAGLDLLRATPLIEKLLKAENLPTKIGGIIFNQAGGLYDQNRLDFLTSRKDKHITFTDEAKMLYPTFEDLANVETEIELAKEKGDKGLELQKKRQLSQMIEARQNPPLLDLLDESNRKRLADIENAINHSIDKKTAELDGKTGSVESILKERQDILVGLIKKAFGSAEADPQPFNPAAYVKMVPTALWDLSRTAPLEDRSKLSTPVGVLMSEDEAYFKSHELLNSNSDRRTTEGHTKLFPMAENVYLAKANDWSHNGTLVDQPRFAGMITSLINRMRRDKQESTKHPQEVVLTL